jgi:hypothetical protein
MEPEDERNVKKPETRKAAPLDSEKLTDSDLENVSGGATGTCECQTAACSAACTGPCGGRQM